MNTNPLFSDKHFIVISYDIVDNKKRYRVMKLLKSNGFHVQKSVFECILTPKQLGGLKQRLSKIIDSQTDSVRIYELCNTCETATAIIGRGSVSEAPLVMVL